MSEKLIDSRTCNSLQLLQTFLSELKLTLSLFFVAFFYGETIIFPVPIGGTNKLFLLRDAVEDTK